MLIRREVYFSAIDELTGEERLYSTTELIDEDAYLDELMFSKNEEEEKPKKKMSRAAKAALIATGTAATAAGAVYGGKVLGKKVIEKKLNNSDLLNKLIEKEMKKSGKSAIEANSVVKDRIKNGFYAKIQKPADYVSGQYRRAADYLSKVSTKEGRAAMRAAREEAKAAKKAAGK